MHLSLAANDNVGVVEMNLYYNDAWQGWEAYASSKDVVLTGSEGTRQVDVQYRDAAGNAGDVYSDTIILDTTPPATAVDDLPASQSDTSFPVSWTGSDDSSGLACYDVQYRDGEGSEWVDWQSCTLSTAASFTGVRHHTYYFRSSAQDNAGNSESFPAGPDYDAATTVEAPTAVTLSSFSARSGLAPELLAGLWLGLAAVIAGGIAGGLRISASVANSPRFQPVRRAIGHGRNR